jgi:hypothetical protein
MEVAVLAPLAAWEPFYVIVGSSAAALTGLQFVVIALIAGGRRRGSLNQIDAFGTPTIMHFCATLLISAILSAPWQGLSSVAVALGASGAAGVAYSMIVVRRARRQTGYKPVLEDWIWHAALPVIAYVVLLAAALALGRRPASALFAIAAAALLLLFIGIHNAWDAVTYIAIEWLPRPNDSGNESP